MVNRRLPRLLLGVAVGIAFSAGLAASPRAFHEVDAGPAEPEVHLYLPVASLASAAVEVGLELVGQHGGGADAVAIQGRFAYLGQGPKLLVVDVLDPANPQVVGQTTVLAGVVGSVAVSAGYAFVAADGVGLRVIDVSTPTSPHEVAFAPVSDGARDLFEMRLVEGHLYAAAGYGGLRVFDVGDPMSPREVGSINIPGYARGVHVVDGHAYVAAQDGGLHVIDVSEPTAPRELASVEIPDLAWCVYVVDGYAYVGAEGEGLRVIDISTPAAPREVAFVDTPGLAHWCPGGERPCVCR